MAQKLIKLCYMFLLQVYIDKFLKEWEKFKTYTSETYLIRISFCFIMIRLRSQQQILSIFKSRRSRKHLYWLLLSRRTISYVSQRSSLSKTIKTRLDKILSAAKETKTDVLCFIIDSYVKKFFFEDSQIPFDKLNRQIEPSQDKIAKIGNDE